MKQGRTGWAGSELGVATVAEWRISAVFAATKEDFLGGVSCVFHGLKPGVFVGTVAKRLSFGFSARTPEIGLTFDNFDRIWGFLGNHRGL
ncbi:hypothetical protein RA28_03940 [Ruegeria sp. ANG-S4]|nr:hypothetical protein RA28_03940 [Ruegeria sp. ANG-S4]